ncbi:MAG: 3'-5' exonuclease [Burkholderiaceae bacterium]
MAVLIPALGSCVARMTRGERRVAERLEDKLDADYLLWYDVAVGPKHQHPDFVVMHPRRGILILEVKDFRLSTLIQANKQTWDIHGERGPKTIPNPLEQARQYAHQVVNALERDPQLVQPEGRHQGKLAFPWSYGVVLPNITRAQFDKAELAHAIEPHRVVCQDEMGEQVDPEALQSRLWDMFPHGMWGVMSLPQLDRVRWIMFPEVRVQVTGELFAQTVNDEDEAAELPSIMRVMDLQQEQLARSLGDGHRVIHGVAGSGKTLLLGYRAEHLAKAVKSNDAAASKPILILCYNEPLARQIARVMTAKGIADRVHAVHFHKWCRQQLVAYGQDLPPQNQPWDAFFEDMVQRVITGVDRRQIPSGQYQAVLIDEGHDFAPEWLRLVVQMVDPATNSLLVLYDDAQSIYDRTQKSKNFSFKSVGIQAQGRTTILKINYRNTRQILQTASLVAADLLTAEDKDDDGVPLLKPVSCGRDGEAPLIVRLPTLREEVAQVAELLATAHREGHAWADMAILCRHHSEMDMCAEFLRKRKLPHQLRRNSSSVFDPAHDSIKVMTLHVSKGLEFPVVALVGAGRMPAEGEDEREEARLFYVGATRATQRLVIGASGGGKLAVRL